MSARSRLAASYVALLLIAAAAFTAVLIYLLHFVPLRVNSIDAIVPGRSDLVTAVLPRAFAVLGVLVMIGAVGGWFLAGRMLRPLHRMHTVAQSVAAEDLSRRIRLTHASAEFQDLADALDAMLDRVEAAVDEQHRFAANASHELRTPLAVIQALLDVAQADIEHTDFPQLLLRIEETNRRALDTTEALLALAELDHLDVVDRVPVDLVELVDSACRELQAFARAADVSVSTALEEADWDAHPALMRQLVVNLLMNAVRYNHSQGGRVWVRTRTTATGVVIEVENTGPPVPPELVPRLTEPFVRGSGRTAATTVSAGSGLGLAIVARIAAAHDAQLRLHLRTGGGLVAQLTLARR